MDWNAHFSSIIAVLRVSDFQLKLIVTRVAAEHRRKGDSISGNAKEKLIYLGSIINLLGEHENGFDINMEVVFLAGVSANLNGSHTRKYTPTQTNTRTHTNVHAEKQQSNQQHLNIINSFISYTAHSHTRSMHIFSLLWLILWKWRYKSECVPNHRKPLVCRFCC